MFRSSPALLALALAFTLSACDTTDSGDAPDARFTATVSGAESGTIEGDVQTRRLFASGPQQVDIALRADCECFAVGLSLFLAEGEGIEERTYAVVPTPDQVETGEALGLIGFGSDGPLYGATGRLVVTEVDGDVVRATIDLTGDADGETVAVEGALIAVVEGP